MAVDDVAADDVAVYSPAEEPAASATSSANEAEDFPEVVEEQDDVVVSSYFHWLNFSRVCQYRVLS